MADSENEQTARVRRELNELLNEMRADEEQSARERAIQIAEVMRIGFGIETTVHKASTYRDVSQRQELAISIPESSFDKLLRMIERTIS